MTPLDQVSKIRRWDKRWQVLTSIEATFDQFEQGWQEAKLVKIPSTYSRIDNIIMMGMGGSGLTARLIKAFYYNRLPLPLETVQGYNLPAYLSRNSLVVITSYSGNTEETLECFKQALAKRAKLFVITTNGRLSRLAQQAKVPFYYINDELNPSTKARLGLAYTLAGQLAILKKLGLIKFGEKGKRQLAETFARFNQKFGLDNPVKKNPAKTIASRLTDRAVMITAAEFLTANAYILSIKLGESSNNFATDFQLPEINHYLMDGLTHPRLNRKLLEFLFLESDFYLEENQQRISATKDVLTKNNIGFVSYQAKSASRLSQIFEVLLFSSYLSFYLAILNKESPRAAPWVDYFKKRLARYR